MQGIDKQQVGEVAANIRKLRKPDPYKGHACATRREDPPPAEDRKEVVMGMIVKRGKSKAAARGRRHDRLRKTVMAPPSAPVSS